MLVKHIGIICQAAEATGDIAEFRAQASARSPAAESCGTASCARAAPAPPCRKDLHSGLVQRAWHSQAPESKVNDPSWHVRCVRFRVTERRRLCPLTHR